MPEAQLRRDLQLLWMCGLPGHGPGDLIDLSFEGDTVSVGHDAGLARPLRLTTDEALALVVALRTLADQPRLTDRGAVERALAKVEAAAGGAVEAASAVAVAVEPTDRVLAQLRGALDQSRAVHLTYYVAGRDETTERDVDPVRLRWADGRWYLEAWCRSVGAMRFFRIDRVDAVRDPGRAVGAAGRRGPARPVRGHLPAGTRAPAGHRCGWTSRAGGSPTTTRARRRARCPTAGSR